MMRAPNKAAPRGRPPQITRERIAAAGIAIGLPQLTFVGVAEALGVSHMALYKHVPSLDALKQLVAEAIFTRWEFLPPSGDIPLADYLGEFVVSLRALVKAHPGLPAQLMRPSAASKRMLEKIDAHHRAVARAFNLPKAQARWLLSTIAFHCIAVADMVYHISTHNDSSTATTTAKAAPLANASTEAETAATTADADTPLAHNKAAAQSSPAKRKRDATVMQREFLRGMQALIIGALALLEQSKAPSNAKR